MSLSAAQDICSTSLNHQAAVKAQASVPWNHGLHSRYTLLSGSLLVRFMPLPLEMATYVRYNPMMAILSGVMPRDTTVSCWPTICPAHELPIRFPKVTTIREPLLGDGSEPGGKSNMERKWVQRIFFSADKLQPVVHFITLAPRKTFLWEGNSQSLIHIFMY